MIIRGLHKMENLRITLFLIIYTPLLAHSFRYAQRDKRSLVFPGNAGKVQFIMGAGFPVDLEDETVIVGIVSKNAFPLPTNSSYYTNPGVVYARKKRTSVFPSRWDIYSLMGKYVEIFGGGGKSCILKTICELSDVPINKSTGIVEEILHVLFTPSTTNEMIHHHSDNEFYAAQQIGKGIKGNCQKLFSDCKISLVDMFTKKIK